MYFILVPIIIFVVYVIKIINSRKKHSTISKAALVVLFLSAFMGQLVFVYEVMNSFGYTEGAVLAYTMLIISIVFLLVLINFTAPRNKAE